MNIPPKANLGAIVIGFGVMAIGMSFGANSGYAINPARDFGPRVFTWLAGWGEAAFPGDTGGPLRRLLVGAHRRAGHRSGHRRGSSTTSSSTTS